MSLVNKLEKLIDYVQDTRQTFLDRGVNIPDTAGLRDFENAATQLHSKTLALVDRTVTELTAKDLAGLTTIGAGAFNGCTNLVKIIIPDNVIDIDSSAFADCVNLTYIEFANPNGWQISDLNGSTSISVEDAALNAINLKAASTSGANWQRFSLGLSFTSNNDGTCALSGIGSCTDTYLRIPNTSPAGDTVTSIAANAFKNSTKLIGVIMPDSITTLETYAFYSCAKLSEVKFSTNLTTVGTYCFYYNTNLTKIVLPDSLTTLGSNAFYGCSNLLSVTLGVGLTTINYNAFWDCSKLAEVINNSQLAIYCGSSDHGYVGYYAMMVHSGPESKIRQCGEFIFCEDTSNYLVAYTGTSSDLILPNGYKNETYKISRTMRGSNTLKTISIPSGVTSIEDGAFANCANLTALSIGSDITFISQTAFSSANKLLEIINYSNVDLANHPLGKKAIEVRTSGTFKSLEILDAFYIYTAESGTPYIVGCDSALITDTYLTLPETINGRRYKIHKEAFRQISLAGITFGNGVISIGNSAFSGATIPRLFIPSTVEKVGAYAFDGAYINQIIISKKTALEDYVFRYCQVPSGGILWEAYCLDFDYQQSWTENALVIDEYYSWDDELQEDVLYQDTLYLSETNLLANDYLVNKTGALVAYIGASNILQIPEGITQIPDYFCQYDSSITEVICPEGLTSIGYNAFAYSSLMKISLPNSIKTIENAAFDGCNLLATNTYSGCSYLGNEQNPYLYLYSVAASGVITIHENTQIIKNDLFINNTSITKVTLPSSLTTIPDNTFNGCSRLSSIIIPESVTKIGMNAFSRCTSLTTITLGKNLTSVSSSAFYNCTKLTRVNITDLAAWCQISFVASNAHPFNAVTAGGDIYLNNTLVTSVSLSNIKAYSFYKCKSITDVTLTNSVVQVPAAAFYGCTGLKNISIPDSITSIGSSAFQGCSTLTTLTIPNSVKTIYSGAFSNCSKLASLTLPFVGQTKNGTTYSNFGYIFGTSYYSSNNSYVPSSLKSVIIRSGNIANNAFYGCKNLTNLTLGSDVTKIGTKAFYNCSGLTNVAFENTADWYVATTTTATKTALPEITAETAINYLVSSYVYYYWTWLGACLVGQHTADTILPAVAPTCTTTGLTEGKKCSICAEIVVPQEEVPALGHEFVNGICTRCGALKASEGLEITTYTSGSNTYGQVMSIGTCTDTDIVIPTAMADGTVIKKIAANAFEGTNITSLNTNINLTTIEASAFKSCTSLTDVIIGNEVTSLGSYAFYGCSALTNLTLGTKLSTIGTYAFSGGVKVSNLYLTNLSKWCTMHFEEEEVFDEEYGYPMDLVGFSSPLSATTEVYLNNQLLADLIIPDDVSCVTFRAFEYCKSLRTVTIPNGGNVCGFAFRSCPNLTRVNLGGFLNDQYVFDGYYTGSTFANCINLRTVELLDGFSFENKDENSYDSFASDAFSGCVKLWEIINHAGIEGLVPGQSSNSSGGLTAYAIDIHRDWESHFIEENEFVFHDASGSLKLAGYAGGQLEQSELVLPTTYKNISCNYSIGPYAFYKNTSITKVLIPDCVVGIDKYAFNGCTNIVELALGNNTLSLGDYSFTLTKITSITIPAKVNSIGINPFGSSTSSILETIQVDSDNATYAALDGVLFSKDFSTLVTYPKNKADTAYTMPNTVTTVENSAFYNCTGLKNLTISENLVTSKPDAYWGLKLDIVQINNLINWCNIDFIEPPRTSGIHYLSSGTSVPFSTKTQLYVNGSIISSLVIPEGVSQIKYNVFKNLKTVPKIVLPASLTKIASNAFESTNFTEVHITDLASWTAIDFDTPMSNPLFYAKNLYLNGELVTDLLIPNSVTSIGSNAFNQCTSLTSIVIPDSVTSIGERAFYGCKNLTSVTIPNSVTSIDELVFSSCTSLTSVYITDIAKWCGISFGDASSNPLYYAKNLYLNGEPVTDLVIPNSVTSINSYVFYNCSNITRVTMNNNMGITVNTDAFYGCSKIAGVYISDLGAWASTTFGDTDANPLTKAKNLYLNDELVTDLSALENTNITAIGAFTFYGCSSLTAIVIPEGVTSIGKYAFYNCDNVTSLVVPESITSFGNYAFNDCDALTDVTIKANCKLGSYAFSDCNKLVNLVLEEGITGIDERAFSNCTSLTSVTIPDSVTEIGPSAFYGCTGLTQVNLGSGIESISQCAFNKVGNTTTAQQVTFDFSKATQIPSLATGSTSSYYAVFYVPTGVTLIIEVPTNLYSSWRKATNWSSYSSKIISA